MDRIQSFWVFNDKTVYNIGIPHWNHQLCGMVNPESKKPRPTRLCSTHPKMSDTHPQVLGLRSIALRSRRLQHLQHILHRLHLSGYLKYDTGVRSEQQARANKWRALTRFNQCAGTAMMNSRGRWVTIANMQQTKRVDYGLPEGHVNRVKSPEWTCSRAPFQPVETRACPPVTSKEHFGRTGFHSESYQTGRV